MSKLISRIEFHRADPDSGIPGVAITVDGEVPDASQAQAVQTAMRVLAEQGSEPPLVQAANLVLRGIEFGRSDAGKDASAQ